MPNISHQNDKEISKKELKQKLQEKQTQLKELEQAGKNSQYIQTLSDIALLELELNRYKEAEEKLKTCLVHFKKQKDKLGQAAVLGMLGTLYYKQEGYEETIKYFEKAAEIYDQLKQKKELITSYKFLGEAYSNLSKREEATDIYLKCSELCSETNDIYNLLDCLGQLISVYEDEEQWDLVYELYLKVLEAFQELDDTRGIVNTYFNLGILEGKKLEDDQQALDSFKRGTNAAIDANYAEMIIKGLSYVGETLFRLDKNKEAKHQFIRALDLSKKVGAKNAKLQIELLLKSTGLTDEDLKKRLNEYRNTKDQEELLNS
ncbi:MAG: tetratricopeptide repeat protein [Promethearchaeia archaeon]